MITKKRALILLAVCAIVAVEVIVICALRDVRVPVLLVQSYGGRWMMLSPAAPYAYMTCLLIAACVFGWMIENKEDK